MPTACDAACPRVCGCDGKSYCSQCEAHKAGVDVDPNSSKCTPSDAGADSATDAAADTGTDAAAD